jgi:alpha-1,3-mannosyltransferase
VVNCALALVHIRVETHRYGYDYQAYIQQAAAVLMGETDYTKISSNQGPCFYPAGHIWHFLPAAWLHYNTKYAEIIMKAVFIGIHSFTNFFIGKIAYLYLENDCESQLIILSLLSNKDAMLYYLEMFNDEIMMLYLILCIYYAITNKPVAASFFLTMGVGVKAGLLLIIPGFLGSI